jgi:hypothetical protein
MSRGPGRDRAIVAAITADVSMLASAARDGCHIFRAAGL